MADTTYPRVKTCYQDYSDKAGLDFPFESNLIKHMEKLFRENIFCPNCHQTYIPKNEICVGQGYICSNCGQRFFVSNASTEFAGN